MPEPGTLLEGKYEILSKLREGGMGAIYKVRHRLLDELRVIKVMRQELHGEEDLRERFTQEAKTATRLKHPNIGSVIDFALDPDGTAYIVMEYIDGVTLSDVEKAEGPPGLPFTLETARQALSALGYLHRKNVIHRDIAPDNLMLTVEDGRPIVKLIDLGVAKALDRTVELTSTGVFLGKVRYCSPEQLGGLKAGEKLDGRSDLYSLGVVLYEALTGRQPYAGETPRELFAQHLFHPPLPFSESDPQGRVPEEVRAAVVKSLAKNRDDRFASAEEFEGAVTGLQHLPGAAADPPAMAAVVERARKARGPSGIPVTPSAQDRIDRRFEAQPTPYTAPRPDISTAETERMPLRGASAGGLGPTVREEATPAPVPAGPRRPSRAVWVAAGAALIALAAGGIYLASRRGEPPSRAHAAMAPTEVPAAPTAAVPAAAAARAPEPAAQPMSASEASAAPTRAPAVAPKTAPPRRAATSAPKPAAPPAPTAAPKTAEKEEARGDESLKVHVGDPAKKVRSHYETIERTITRGNRRETFLNAASAGLRFFFDRQHNVRAIRFQPPYRGALEGVRLGDTVAAMKSKKGPPLRGPFAFEQAEAYIYRSKTAAENVRYEVDRGTGRVVGMAIFTTRKAAE